MLAAISKTQAVALRQACLDATSAGSLGPEEASQCVLELAKCKWHTQAHFAYATGPLSAEKLATKARRPMQDWQSLPAYFPDELWALLAGSSTTSTGKLEAILTFAAKGGLRLPSEGTIKLLTSIWLLTAEKQADLLSACQKQVGWQLAEI